MLIWHSADEKRHDNDAEAEDNVDREIFVQHQSTEQHADGWDEVIGEGGEDGSFGVDEEVVKPVHQAGLHASYDNEIPDRAGGQLRESGIFHEKHQRDQDAGGDVQDVAHGGDGGRGGQVLQEHKRCCVRDGGPDEGGYAGDAACDCVSPERWQEDKENAGKSEKNAADLEETHFFPGNDTDKQNCPDRRCTDDDGCDTARYPHLPPGDKKKRQNGFE